MPEYSKAVQAAKAYHFRRERERKKQEEKEQNAKSITFFLSIQPVHVFSNIHEVVLVVCMLGCIWRGQMICT